MGMVYRFRDWRNRLFSDPSFQRWAASFPLTRPIAQHRARRIFDITAGFVYSQILYACVDLGVFPALQKGSMTTDELASKIAFPNAGTERLARAAVSLSLLERRGDKYALGPHGAALLGNPSVFAMVRHHATLYADLADPVGLLRERSKQTALAQYWNYDAGGSADYSGLMAQTQAFIAAEVLSVYDFGKHRSLTDIGGGAGAFLCAVKKQYPSLEATLCDLPNVVPLAQRRFIESGIEAEAVECNFLQQSLPKGSDVITLVRVLHDHDDHAALALLKAIREALPEGGTLLIAEPLAETPGAEPVGDAYFGMYLWAMGSGRPRSLKEIRQFLAQAGFAHAKEVKTQRPILARIIAAS